MKMRRRWAVTSDAGSYEMRLSLLQGNLAMAARGWPLLDGAVVDNRQAQDRRSDSASCP